MKNSLVFVVLVFIFSAALAAQTPAKNKANMEALYEAFNQRRFDGLDKYIAPDFIDHGIPAEFIEQTGLKGPELLAGFIEAFIQGFPDVQFKPIYCIAEGDMAMCYMSMSGTHTQPFMGIPATGRSFSIYDADIVRFNNKGQVVEHWAVQDGTELMSIIGHPGIEPGLRFLAAMDNNDLPALNKAVSTDFRIYHPNFPEPLTAEAFFEQQVRPVNAAISNIKHEVVESCAEGNRLVMRGIVTGKHTGELMGIPASGNEIMTPWIAFATLDDNGRIRELHVQFNQIAFLTQLGMNPMAKK